MMDNVDMAAKTRRKRPQRASPENRTLTELADMHVPFLLGDIVVDIEMAAITSEAGQSHNAVARLELGDLVPGA